MSVQKQIEFYFSNQNYYKDTFLRTTCEENNGIDIKVLLTFKKLAELKCTEEQIRDIAKNLECVELEGENKLKKIKDKSYDEYITRKHDDYMIVIEGLDQDLSLNEIESELEKYFNPLFIRMKRKGKKEFIGAVLVELESKEEVERVLKLEIPFFKKKKDIEDIEANSQVISKESNLIDEKMSSESSKNATQKNEQIDQKDNTTITSIKKKSEQENSKKQKLNLLTISKKVDYQNSIQKLNQQKNKRNNFYEINKNKVFKFETDKEYEIKDIRKILKGVAFVDINNKVLRLKQAKDESEIEINDNFKIKKLNDSEYKAYVDKIQFNKKKK